MIEQHIILEQEAVDSRAKLRVITDKYYLTVEQYITLYTISKINNCCAADVERKTHLQSPSLVRISANLRKRELVYRVRNGKKNALKLTNEGQSLLNKVNRQVKKFEL